MIWMSLVTTHRWFGQVHIKLGVDWQSVHVVGPETNRSSITSAITAQCELFSSAMSCKISLDLTMIYCNHVSKLPAGGFSFRTASAKVFFITDSLELFHFKIFLNAFSFSFCHSGNRVEQLGTPYKKGKACSSCPQSCHSKKIRFVNSTVSDWCNSINTSFSSHLRLCRNSCNAADLWANCRELHQTWPDWLCRTNTSEGLQRQQNCLATCNCHGKIYD